MHRFVAGRPTHRGLATTDPSLPAYVPLHVYRPARSSFLRGCGSIANRQNSVDCQEKAELLQRPNARCAATVRGASCFRTRHNERHWFPAGNQCLIDRALSERSAWRTRRPSPRSRANAA
jgi:hypothetical protein